MHEIKQLLPYCWRYPLLKGINLICSLLVIWHFGISWQTVAALLLTWGLFALALIDWEHYLLPDVITLPLLGMGLLLNLGKIFCPFTVAFIGAISGYAILWLCAWLFTYTTGKVGMGQGDFKLLAMLGAWLGWQQLPLIILLSSLTGSIFGIGLVLIKKQSRQQLIPFGPFLALGGYIALFYGPAVLQYYNHLFVS